MRAYSRVLCVSVLSALPVVSCLSDVEYLRSKQGESDAGTANAESGTKNGGSSGNGGVFAVGGVPGGGAGTAGTMSEDAGMGGDLGTGGAVIPMVDCDDQDIVKIFEFEETGVVSGLNTGPWHKWSRGPYDSTNTATGATPDTTASPPGNAKNLANLSLLVVDAKNGDLEPSMSMSIPINPAVRKEQVVNVLYVFANYGVLAEAVDLSKATLKARLKILTNPHPNCKMSATPWTTGTSTGSDFQHKDGEKFPLTTNWSNVTMDLSKSTLATSINQYGFVLKSACSEPEPMGEGGAGGMDAGGAPGTGGTAGTGGMGGSAGAGGYTGPKTVVLFDNIETTCAE